MPTGYTQMIIDGKVKSPKDFLHLCLRGFGILYSLSDKPLDVREDYSQDIMKSTQADIDYHKKLMEDAQERLNQIREMSDDDLYQKYVQEKSSYKKSCEDLIRKNEGINAKYADFTEKIRNWECSSDYESVKNFALEQLNISNESTRYWEEELAKIGDLSREDFDQKKDEYKASLVVSANWDLQYHQKEMEEAISEQTRKINYYHFFKQELEKLK